MRVRFHQTPLGSWELITLLTIVVLLGVGLPPAVHATRHAWAGTKTIGDFNRVEWVGGLRKSSPYVWFSFELPDGQRRTQRTRYPAPFIASTTPPRVPISYMAADPKDADIYLARHLWGVPLFALVLLIGPMLLAVRWVRTNVVVTF